jgi:uncharacterized membrane protein YeaQ/YmgE (transglycosylase-associated protein family)
MVFAYTLVLSDLAVELITGAIIAVIVGRIMRGGFGVIGDIILGLVGAVVLAFVVTYFGLFNIAQYGLAGTIIVALIGAIVLTALVHLFTSRRTAAAA